VSVQFGKWNLDGKPPDRGYVENVQRIIAPYAPDGAGSFMGESISLHFQAFHTTKDSRAASQPYVTSSVVVTWDGRLDNRAELIGQMRDALTNDSSDVAIAAAAYAKWGITAFGKLVGDWAFVIWDRKTQSLILAKDFVGTRSLYYSADNDHITWSTLLDPLVLLATKSFSLSTEYIAGSLSYLPAASLTPFAGICAVSPSCYVLLEKRRQTTWKYWDFDPNTRIRYHIDGEYEEHFRSVFRQSVCRRLRSDAPVLAELSGGMDSSSIVCVADSILAAGNSETPRLDTISYYDDAEPGWNDRPYFELVERHRGLSGCHMDVGWRNSFRINFGDGRFSPVPVAPGYSPEFHEQFASSMALHGNRVVLSGIGGDEVTGGVPTSVPEICDLLAMGQLLRLASKLKLWALHQRKPWFHVLWEAARRFVPPVLVGMPKHKGPEPWLDRKFVKEHRAVLYGYQRNCKVFGPLPSFQENLFTLEKLRRQLAYETAAAQVLCETRYPYLDRDLLEFLYSIPREQLVRPGHRRSLMRRALIGIVPEEILNRKRKAFVARAPMASFVRDWSTLTEITRDMMSSRLGIISAEEFLHGLQKARQGAEVPLVALLRALSVEAWLRMLARRGLLPGHTDSQKSPIFAAAHTLPQLK